MDDLDHSMYIAEDDWTSFYEDSEECDLLQPSLACPDNLSLSDSEDSGNSGSAFSVGRSEPQQSPAADTDEAGSSAAACCMEEVQINHSREEDELTRRAEEGKSGLDYPGGNAINTVAAHITEVANDDVTTTPHTGRPNVQSPDAESTELKRDDGDVQTESDASFIHGPDPLSCREAELHANEPHTADRDVSQDVSSVTARPEKERWFVTVSDSPARRRVRATTGKKKRRQKKPCKNNLVCRTAGQEDSYERGLELEISSESEGGRGTENVRHSNQNSGGYPSAEENLKGVQMGIVSDLSQTSGEEDKLSDKPVTINRDTSHDTFTPKDPSRLDSEESEGLGDGVEFLSAHSYDSESYLSATESVEEPQHLLMENQQSSSSLTENSCPLSRTENTHADDTQDSPSCGVTATDGKGHESTDVELTLTPPSAAQSVNKVPDDNSTCDNDTHCTELCMPSDTLQKQEINHVASGCSSGNQLSPPSVPDVTVTPCSVADSPETYAVAAGHTRPVYAISAFWDEMEKLTINDILQLKMGRRDTQETVTTNVDHFPTDHSPLVDTVEYNSSDGGLMDTSDTADSDYFTQPDEYKPDRSSCDFSTSDFEEEYWQFLGTSRNPSPDPQNKNQQRTSESPFSAREEEESTASEGKETPVPSEDFAEGCFEDQDSNAFISGKLARPRQITKSKSMRNVHALNTEDLSLLGDDESGLFLSSCQFLEESVLLKATDSLDTVISAPFLSSTDVLDEHPQIFFPEVTEFFFTEDKAKGDSRCATVFSPDDISVAPLFDSTLCTFRDETSFSFLCDSVCSGEIPIFSCSHPNISVPTFPNYLLSADCTKDDISPIRVVSHSFIHGSDCAAAKLGFRSWKSLWSMRKICFHDKGSIWCGGSGAWVFPVDAEKITTKREHPLIAVLTEGPMSSSPAQLYRELPVQQRVLETIQTTRREGIFSTLRQSDMCLVCIAFSSWVLRSSDPEATDAWKAALLANVSALSAIQYLRQYVKRKKNPSQDGP